MNTDVIEGNKLTLNTGIIIGNNITQEDVNRVNGNRLIALFMGADVDENQATVVDHFPDKEGNIINKYVMGKYYFPNKDNNDYDKVCNLWQLKYHSSWDWLMPVIEKIESIEMPEHRNDYNHIVKKGVLANISIHRVREVSKKEDGYYCTIQLWDYDALRFEVISKKSRIDATYLCVIKFIKWYNTIKQ